MRRSIVLLIAASLLIAVASAGERQRPSYAASLTCEYDHLTGTPAEHAGILAIHVMDWSGEPIPEGKVIATPSNSDVRAVTGQPDASGRVVFRDLPSGKYLVSVDVSGFVRVTARGVRVQGGCLAAISLPMSVVDISN